MFLIEGEGVVVALDVLVYYQHVETQSIVPFKCHGALLARLSMLWTPDDDEHEHAYMGGPKLGSIACHGRPGDGN